MSIYRYLEQLVDDIRESAKNKDHNISYPPELVVAPNVPEHLEHLPVIPVRPVYKWMRLDPEAFPPAEQLNEMQIIYFCNILRQLFEHYNYEVQLPRALPYNMVYHYLIKAFYKVEPCNQENLNTIYFCEGDESNCPFGEYCGRVNDDFCNSWIFGHWWEGYSEVTKQLPGD